MGHAVGVEGRGRGEVGGDGAGQGDMGGEDVGRVGGGDGGAAEADENETELHRD